MRDAFIAFDAEFRVLDANPAAELYFGSPKDELIGRDLRISIPEMQTSAGWSIFERVLRTAEPTDFTMNSPVYIGRRLRVQAFPYDHGLGVIFTNMAAIEEAHLLEKRSEAVQAALECEGAMSIIRLNARGGIEAVDNAFCGMSGFTQEQLLSLMLPEIVYMRDRPAVNGAFNACIREKKPKMASVALMAKDGSERALHLCMSAVFNDAVPAEVIVCAVDHTVSASNAAAAV